MFISENKKKKEELEYIPFDLLLIKQMKHNYNELLKRTKEELGQNNVELNQIKLLIFYLSY